MSLIETTDVVATPTQKLTEIFYRAVMRPVQGNRKLVQLSSEEMQLQLMIGSFTISLSIYLWKESTG